MNLLYKDILDILIKCIILSKLLNTYFLIFINSILYHNDNIDFNFT